jgi:hypothetical protein
MTNDESSRSVCMTFGTLKRATIRDISAHMFSSCVADQSKWVAKWVAKWVDQKCFEIETDLMQRFKWHAQKSFPGVFVEKRKQGKM